MAGFDGGDITSNTGGLLVGQVDRGLGRVRRFAECFSDRRDPRYIEHRVETLVGQRIFGLELGYEDSTVTTNCARIRPPRHWPGS
jgi:DDE family transposase